MGQIVSGFHNASIFLLPDVDSSCHWCNFMDIISLCALTACVMVCVHAQLSAKVAGYRQTQVTACLHCQYHWINFR